jgi:hypothetical protein
MLFEWQPSLPPGDPEDAARKILQDYRSRRMGTDLYAVLTEQRQGSRNYVAS